MADNTVLLICAKNPDSERVESICDRASASITCASTNSLLDAVKLLQEDSFDLIITDLTLSDGKDLAILKSLQQHAPSTPVLVLCSTANRDAGVTAVRNGAFDFFCYEDGDASLLKSVESAIRDGRLEAERKTAAERRINARFPVSLGVSYQTLEHPMISGQGTSETLNVSSKGILFTSSENFQVGQLVQVSLDWPARLENQIPLKLVAEGRIVRNSGGADGDDDREV
jgi:DNA-binding NarL/FixJ family response regulator